MPCREEKKMIYKMTRVPHRHRTPSDRASSARPVPGPVLKALFPSLLNPQSKCIRVKLLSSLSRGSDELSSLLCASWRNQAKTISASASPLSNSFTFLRSPCVGAVLNKHFSSAFRSMLPSPFHSCKAEAHLAPGRPPPPGPLQAGPLSSCFISRLWSSAEQELGRPSCCRATPCPVVTPSADVHTTLGCLPPHPFCFHLR